MITSLQKALAEAIEKKGVKVELEYKDGYKTIDIFLPEANIAIEVDGIQHVTDPKQIIADFNREYYSSQKNIPTIHISNEVVKKSVENIAEAISEVVKQRKVMKKIGNFLPHTPPIQISEQVCCQEL